ncbi:MAG: hypothetical protein ACI9FN_001974 [Saprospiraceae bacterium]|jgi:hypothetical protein
MNLKKSVLSLGLVITVILPSIASPNAPEASNTVIQKIAKTISQLAIDYSEYAGKELKVKFLINESDELIILSTYDSELDLYIKSALNYVHVPNSDLKAHKIYILPVKFATKRLNSSGKRSKV